MSSLDEETETPIDTLSVESSENVVETTAKRKTTRKTNS